MYFLWREKDKKKSTVLTSQRTKVVELFTEAKCFILKQNQHDHFGINFTQCKPTSFYPWLQFTKFIHSISTLESSDDTHGVTLKDPICSHCVSSVNENVDIELKVHHVLRFLLKSIHIAFYWQHLLVKRNVTIKTIYVSLAMLSSILLITVSFKIMKTNDCCLDKSSNYTLYNHS